MVAGHCASKILIVRIIGELYAQVSLFPTMKIEIVFVVAGHCASEILIVRIIGELYAQVSLFPTMSPETG